MDRPTSTLPNLAGRNTPQGQKFYAMDIGPMCNGKNEGKTKSAATPLSDILDGLSLARGQEGGDKVNAAQTAGSILRKGKSQRSRESAIVLEDQHVPEEAEFDGEPPKHEVKCTTPNERPGTREAIGVEEERDVKFPHWSNAADIKWRNRPIIFAVDPIEGEEQLGEGPNSDAQHSALLRNADVSPRAEYQLLQIQKGDSSVTSELLTVDASDPRPLFDRLDQEYNLEPSWRLELLIVPKESSSNTSQFFKYAKMHLRGWKIPDICFIAHENLWSGVMTYAPAGRDGTWKGYLIRNDRGWGWACTLVISHDSNSNITYGVCIGLRAREAEALVEHLEKWKQYAGNPLFVPIALVEIYISKTITMNRRNNTDFYNIQTAMRTDYYINSPSVPQALDLVEVASKLTALGSSGAGVTQLLSTQSRIMHFLGEQLDRLWDEEADVDDVLASLCERHTFLKEVLCAERQHNEYIKAAVQAQVQMVYSLTAQRDNEHNLNLARLSQKQNNINIQISKFAAYESRLSNKMAKSSLKDGVDMQVIAAVTLTFLPGTFIATLFSTSFWNFQPGNQGQVVSKWVWIYCVATVGLTLAVLVAWRFVSRARTDKLELPPEWELGKMLEIEDVQPVEEQIPV